MSTQVSGDAIERAEAIRRAGVESVANIRMTQALIALGIHVTALVLNYLRQKEAQDRQISILEDQQERLRVFWNLERSMLNDYGADGNPGLDPLPPAKYGSIFAGRMVTNLAYKYEQVLVNLKFNAGKYQTSFNRYNISETMRARAIDISNTRIRGYFLGALEYRAKDEINFQRRYDTIALGAGLLSTASEAAAKAAAGFSQLVSQDLNRILGDINDFTRAATEPPVNLLGGTFHSQIQNQLGIETGQTMQFSMPGGGTAQSTVGQVTQNVIATGAVGGGFYEQSAPEGFMQVSSNSTGNNTTMSVQSQTVSSMSEDIDPSANLRRVTGDLINVTSNATAINDLTTGGGGSEMVTALVDVTQDKDVNATVTSTVKDIARGTETSHYFSSNREDPHSPCTWQDRARTGKSVRDFNTTVFDTYTGGGFGYTPVWLAPFELVYVDDQDINRSESGKPL